MNKKLNIAAIAIIFTGLVTLGFIKLGRHATAKKILAWEQQVNKYNDNRGKFQALPDDSQVFISNSFVKQLNTIIPFLDSNLLYEGRSIKEAADPDIVYKVVQAAEGNGGTATGGTSYKGDVFEDKIKVSIVTEYDTSSIKPLTTWEKPVETVDFKYNETRYAYSCKIKVEYEVIVDGEKYKGVHYQQSQINSPMDLLYKYKSK